MGGEKPGAQQDAAPSRGDRHPLLGPPGSWSAPARCKAWALCRGPPIPPSGFPAHGDSRPPPARCPPNPGAERPLCPVGWDAAGGGQAGEPPAAQVSSPPGCQAPSSHPRKQVGATTAPAPLGRVRELSSRRRERGQAPARGPPCPDGRASWDVRLSRVPLSQVTVGKASKAPGDKTAGLKRPRGTRCSAGDWSSTVRP